MSWENQNKSITLKTVPSTTARRKCEICPLVQGLLWGTTALMLWHASKILGIPMFTFSAYLGGWQAVCSIAVGISGVFPRIALRGVDRGAAFVSHVSSPIRESWRYLPHWTQSSLTLLSGKPLAEQIPCPTFPRRMLIISFSEIAIGVALAWMAITGGGCWSVLSLGVVLTAHALRYLTLVIFHECSHLGFTGNALMDTLIGRILGVVTLGQSWESYRPDHSSKHHGKGFMTEDDPTVSFQRKFLGLQRGMSKFESLTRLLFLPLSPQFQFHLTTVRLVSCWGEPGWHRLGLSLFLTSLIALTLSWPFQMLVAWWIPCFVITNIGLAVRSCMEHVYPPRSAGKLNSRAARAICTHAVFFGSALPSSTLGRVGWICVMLFYHLPARALFCPGFSVVHDYHHRKPKAGILINPIFARQVALEGGPTEPYTEVWSLHAAIDAGLRSLSEA